MVYDAVKHGYYAGLASAARAFAEEGNGAAARKALTLASGGISPFMDALKRSEVQIDMASAYFSLGERDAGENLLQAAENAAVTITFGSDYTGIDILVSILKFHLERGNDAEVRRINALIAPLAGKFSEDMEFKLSYAGPTFRSDLRAMLHTVWIGLAKARVAVGDTREAASIVARLTSDVEREPFEYRYARENFDNRIKDLREIIRFAEAGPLPADRLASPEDIADPRERANAWTALARAHIAEGDMLAARRAVGNALTTMDRIDQHVLRRVSSLFPIVELLSSPEGKAAERAWTGQPGAALSPPAVPPGGPRPTLAGRIATY